LISRKDYKHRARYNKLIFVFVATGIAVTNVALIFAQAIDPNKPTSLALQLTILVVFTVMLICFTVIGSILIRRLRLFFKSNYDKQRFSLLTALLLLIACLLTLAARYALEYVYLVHKMNIMPEQ
jgi:threonine/homoserine/homoserine lactone efflux protein